MSKEELSAAAREIWEIFKETDRRLALESQEVKEQFKEVARRSRETDRQQKETELRLKELSKQIGGLGQKFGGFTEGMAFPSMRRLLTEKFKMDNIAPRFLVRKKGESFELDVLAYSNGKRQAAYVVEVKSRLRNENIKEMIHKLGRFPYFFPEHEAKALYGIIAAVDVPEDVGKNVLKAGLYLATIRDDTFCLEVPENFKPKRFNLKT